MSSLPITSLPLSRLLPLALVLTCACSDNTSVFPSPAVRDHSAMAAGACLSPVSPAEVHTYQPCHSSFTNHGRTIPDKTIATTIDGTNQLTVTASTALAGAIASVKINEVEFIASGGHGAAFQWALHAHDAGECYNPTEAGSKTDDRRPNWDTPPYHGPSTSYLYSVAGSSTQFQTVNRPAFYVPAGERSDYDGCTPSYPAGLPYDQNLSPYMIRKTVKVGRDSNPLNLDNIVTISTNITVENPERSTNFDAVLIAYLQEQFNTFYKYDPVSGLTEKVDLNTYATNPGIGVSTKPIIISTADGRYAMGLFVPPALNMVNQETPLYYLGYSSGNNPSYPFQNQTLQVTYYAKNIEPGELQYKSYWAVGNLERVKNTLTTLYNSLGK